MLKKFSPLSFNLKGKGEIRERVCHVTSLYLIDKKSKISGDKSRVAVLLLKLAKDYWKRVTARLETF